MNYFITHDHYIHFVVPAFNSVYRELLRLRNFRPTCYPLRIEYVNNFADSPGITTHYDQDEEFVYNEGSKPEFIGFSFPYTDEYSSYSVSGRSNHQPTLDVAPLMRMDYRAALQAIVDFELPQREYSATYNGYAILCHHLRLRIPCASDVHRCFTCRRKITTDCHCVEYYFGCVQYLQCNCIMGRVCADFCCCDDVPAILHDLDEVRHIQFTIVEKYLDIFNHSIDFLKLMIALYYKEEILVSISVLDYSVHVPIWAMGNYKPP